MPLFFSLLAYLFKMHWGKANSFRMTKICQGGLGSAAFNKTQISDLIIYTFLFSRVKEVLKWAAQGCNGRSIVIRSLLPFFSIRPSVCLTCSRSLRDSRWLLECHLSETEKGGRKRAKWNFSQLREHS